MGRDEFYDLSQPLVERVALEEAEPVLDRALTLCRLAEDHLGLWSLRD